MHSKIPKVCYFYWGATPLPFFNYLSIVSFVEHNPEWRVVMIQPDDDVAIKPTWPTPEQKTNYNGPDYYKRIPPSVEIEFVDFRAIAGGVDIHHVQRADILRKWLMYKRGGMWSDMDVLYVKPIDAVGLRPDVNVSMVNHGWNSTGVVFASPFTPFYHRLYTDSIERIKSPGGYQHVGPDLINELYPTSGLAEATHPALKFQNLAYSTFYPYLPNHIDLFYRTDLELPRGTVGVHWFGGAAASMGRLILSDLDFDQPTTFSKLIRKYKEIHAST